MDKLLVLILGLVNGALSINGYYHDHQELDHRYDKPNYLFKYGVKDLHTGDIKHQWEERDGGVVKGEYSLVEPDGSIRTVTYTADDKNGFNAEVKKTAPSSHPHIKPKPLYKPELQPVYYTPTEAPTVKPYYSHQLKPHFELNYQPIRFNQYRTGHYLKYVSQPQQWKPISKPIMQTHEEGVHQQEKPEIVPLSPTFKYVPGMALLMKHRMKPLPNPKNGPVLFPVTPDEATPATEPDGTPIEPTPGPVVVPKPQNPANFYTKLFKSPALNSLYFPPYYSS